MQVDSGNTDRDFMATMERRLEEAGQRTRAIYAHVGFLCTTFAGLEAELLQLTARLLDPAAPEQKETELSKIPFGNLVSKFETAIRSRPQTPGAVADVVGLPNRLRGIAKERNEIIHSSWVAYTSGDYGQHRARLKGQNEDRALVHEGNPIVRIDAAIEEARQLLWDLIGFCDLEGDPNR